MFVALISLKNCRHLERDEIAEVERSLPTGYRSVEANSLGGMAACFHFSSESTGEQLSFLEKSETCLSVMIGDALLTSTAPRSGVDSVSSFSSDDRDALLRLSRGVFCIVSVSAEQQGIKVELCSDKFGVRPLYYWSNDHFAVVSTTFGVIERLRIVPKICDPKGAAEMAAFGYPLSDRTQYAGILRIGAGEIVSIRDSTVDRKAYWNWGHVSYDKTDLAGRAEEAFRLFVDSIVCRHTDGERALAFLSGGMDSRAIVGALRQEGVPVTTLNFSRKNSQDEILAAEIARKLGCHHIQMPRPSNRTGTFRPDLAELCSSLIEEGRADCPSRKIWSGDGGSVSLGTVHLDDEILQGMRGPQSKEAISRFRRVNGIGLPLKGFGRKERDWHQSLLQECIPEELAKIDHEDPAQRLFLFLMLNDQRRHLDDMYEEQTTHRLSYHLPFYDSELLMCVFAIPLEYRLCHRFYDAWFANFDRPVRSVPWQTYPGHVQCPLPIDESLSYQWDPDRPRKMLGARLSESWKQLGLSIGSESVRPMSRFRLAIAALIHAVGKEDMNYVFKSLDTLRQSRDAQNR